MRPGLRDRTRTTTDPGTCRVTRAIVLLRPPETRNDHLENGHWALDGLVGGNRLAAPDGFNGACNEI